MRGVVRLVAGAAALVLLGGLTAPPGTAGAPPSARASTPLPVPLPDPRAVDPAQPPARFDLPDDLGGPELRTADPLAGQCFGQRFSPRPDDADLARRIMAGYIPITRYRDWKMPSSRRLTWHEDPYHNVNWVAEVNGLRWIDPLRREWLRTGDTALRDEYVRWWHRWLAGNDPAHPKTIYTWQDMVVGLRGVGLTCLAAVLVSEDTSPTWYRQGISDHAAALLDPRQYRADGNHGLHQNMGLMALGCVFGHRTWRATARGRALKLLRRSVDSQGVTDEGSVLYERLNYVWYVEMKSRLTRCGEYVDPAYARVAKMPQFLGYATQPDGSLVAFGDTSPSSFPQGIPGTLNEYAATKGATGTPPPVTTRVYASRGYAFSRSGWFDVEPEAQQSLVALRFGPSSDSAVHGHEDGGTVNLFAFGRQMLWQPGVHGGGGGSLPDYVVRNEAHDVVDIPSRPFSTTGTSRLSARSLGRDVDLFTLHSGVLSGASWTRTVVHLKRAHVLLVDDLVKQRTSRSVVQRWQLGPGRSVNLGHAWASSTGSGSDMRVMWVRPPSRLDVVRARRHPPQGWVSPSVDTFVPSPTLEAWGKGRTVHLTAVLVPRPADTSQSHVRIRSSKQSADRTTMVLDTGRGRWRVVYTRTSVSAVRLS